MSSYNSNSSVSGGVSFCGLLTIVFITLKLTKVINWSWVWVLSPLWLPTAIAFLVLIVILVFSLIKNQLKQEDTIKETTFQNE